MPSLTAPLPGLALAAALAIPAVQAAPATCPQLRAQLSDALAGARQRLRADGEVRVAFDVGTDGKARLVELQGKRVYRTPVRTAVDMLDCRPGTPQRYSLDIRFAAAAPQVTASAASATLAQAR